MKPVFTVLFALASVTIARDFRPKAYFEDIPALDTSVLQCYVFKTLPGIGYQVQVSNDLVSWSDIDEVYGLGHEYVVTMRETAPAPPEDPGSPPPSPPPTTSNPIKSASIRMQPASGTGGGTVIAWPSLDHGGPVIVKIAGSLDENWASVPLYVNGSGDYQFLVWHPSESVEPPATNPPLGPEDAAMLGALEANLPAMNAEVAASAARSRNAPHPAPSDPDSLRFWRIKVDAGIDTDMDRSPDWAEFEIGSRGTGILISGVQPDPFSADSNDDGTPDGFQLDADLDGTADGNDPDVGNNTSFYPIGPLPRYALFPITISGSLFPEFAHKLPLQINDKGRVLYQNGTWSAGVFTPLIAPPGGIQGSQQLARAYGINDNNVILGTGTYHISADPEHHANMLYYWNTPVASPIPIKSGSDIKAGYAGGSIGNTYDIAFTPRSVLSNEGRFTSMTKEWSQTQRGNTVAQQSTGGTNWYENTLRFSTWTLPTGNGLPTEVEGSKHISFHADPELSWGYTTDLDENGNETGPLKGKVLTPAALPDLPFVPYNAFSTPNGILALPPSHSEEAPKLYTEGTWQNAPHYKPAVDISADGIAIGRGGDGNASPLMANGKWHDIERMLPIPSDGFEPTPPWHSSSVTFLDITPGGWILGQRETSPAIHEHAVMLPIRAEGYYTRSDGLSVIEAAGVDDFSIGSDAPGVGIQDRVWIMAPQGGFNKIVKFKSPLNNDTPLKLTAPNILFGSQESISINSAVNSVTLRGEEGALSGGERLLTLSMGSGDNEILSVSKPIGLKIMKGRTVNVTVYKVTKLYGSNAEEPIDQIMMPTQEEITDYLKDTFRPQINTVFNVNLVDEPLKARWDDDTDAKLDINITSNIPGEEEAIIAKIPENPAPYDIRFFIVANPGAALGDGLGAYGLTDRAKATCWVHGSWFAKNKSKQFLLHTIAHEIGHVLVGEGHPDDKTPDPITGPAPLPGTKHVSRLMCSGPNTDGSSHLLVKGEWDKAETWLKAEIDDKEPQ